MHAPVSGQAALEQLRTPPRLAWPTLVLFLVSTVLYGLSSGLALTGHLSTGVAVAVNAVAAYWLFTVFHDASHRAVSRSDRVNDWLGRMAILALLPCPIFKAFRFIHMQHHRFANEDAGQDPDAYTSEGPRWLLPLRWATLDIKYILFYLRRLGSRPRTEQRESVLAFVLGLVLMAGLVAAGWGAALFWLWFVPSRIAIFVLALAFDFLPHHPKKCTQRENPWQATNNRVGLEWLLTPVLLWQNYHLVHHLYPRVPFYRYLRLWRQGEAEFMARDPLLVDIWGRELQARPKPGT